MKRRKLPVRMCASCGEKKPKKEMTRIVRTPGGIIKIDEIGKVSGRGAYICKTVACVALAKKKRIIERHLLSDNGVKRGASDGKRIAPKTDAGGTAADSSGDVNLPNAEQGSQAGQAAIDSAQIEELYKLLYGTCEAGE